MKLASERYHGRIVMNREVAGLRLMESIYPPGLKLEKHVHPRACFSFLLDGAYTELYGKMSLNWRPLTVGFNHPNEEHSSLIQKTGARFFIIEIGAGWLERAQAHSARLDGPAVFRGGILSWLARRLYNEAREVDEVSTLAVEGITLDMMAEVSRRGAKGSSGKLPNWLEQASEIIRASFFRQVTVSSIAEVVGIHPSHLARAFRKHYCCTIGDFVRRLRVEAACREITHSALPLSDIALSAGFYDQSHFSRTFKQIVGVSPAAYRAAFRSC